MPVTPAASGRSTRTLPAAPARRPCRCRSPRAAPAAAHRQRFSRSSLWATLAECARGAVRTRGSQLHGHHNALKPRKLLCTIVAMLREQRPYLDPGHRLRQAAGRPQRGPLAAQARRARLSRAHPFRQPAGGGLRPPVFLAHRRRWRGTSTDTDRGYRGGVRESCASTVTTFLSNHGETPEPGSESRNPFH